jgi:hypothetical protein
MGHPTGPGKVLTVTTRRLTLGTVTYAARCAAARGETMLPPPSEKGDVLR